MAQPFWTQMRDDPDWKEPVRVYRSAENLCEWNRATEHCDTASGLYYGSDDGCPLFCPRHYYQMHFAPQAAYRLIDPSEQELQAATERLKAVAPRLLDALQSVETALERKESGYWPVLLTHSEVEKIRAALEEAKKTTELPLPS